MTDWDHLRADWPFLEERKRRWKELTSAPATGERELRARLAEVRIHHLHAALESIRLNGDTYSAQVAEVALIGKDEWE